MLQAPLAQVQNLTPNLHDAGLHLLEEEGIFSQEGILKSMKAPQSLVTLCHLCRKPLPKRDKASSPRTPNKTLFP
jgi:hypothetical protein